MLERTVTSVGVLVTMCVREAMQQRRGHETPREGQQPQHGPLAAIGAVQHRGVT